jgi:hypothetical protein
MTIVIGIICNFEVIIVPRCTKLPALACADNSAALADSSNPTHIAHVERAMSSIS